MTPEHRRATHPGKVLLEHLLGEDMQPSAYARFCGLTLERLKSLLLGDADMTLGEAWDIAKTTHTSPDLWLNLQAAYDRSGT